MRYVLILALAGFLVQPSSAQTTYAVDDTAYVKAVENAFASLKQGDCKTCLAQYQRAFAISKKSAMSTLRAAVCAYQCQQTELARIYISKATSIDFWISEDIWENRNDYPEFEILRASSLMADFQASVDKQKITEGRNPILERELKEIFRADNQPRLRLDSIGRQYGFNSPQTKSLWTEISRVDSINLSKIERILQQYGYPGKHLVGEKQNITAWLVIQHSPLAIQEKYLPMIQKAADQGELNKSSAALLVDRIRVYKGQKQLYGSQVRLGAGANDKNSFDPIEDEINVDKRRADVGLPPIKDYARQWGIEYIPPKK
ncbi:DUF6624 domain-containing protein [Spirosoma endophyticum]|uniref:Uncharacterized protein n=1 Tax=Spirosoma endophyticum TaxID=662367 RepID=A0A1I1GS23_9BACT|nr:DUF6624 domain-containing protein [Spirosoma endophyticum]SFC14082.1 hypothetical protein SAMN05216167_101538 [Spirosoma endophyticum]